MDVQAGLIYMGVVVISAAVVLLVSIFGIKEKSYEEAIAEQRKFPDDLLLGKKEKVKEKRHKNKSGKKVKEKKEEKGEKEGKQEHVQFEEAPQILLPDLPVQDVSRGSKKKTKSEKVKPILMNKDEPSIIITDSNTLQSSYEDINHFDVIHPKDDLELIKSHSRENLHQISQSELIVTKSPKGTPIKLKKNNKEFLKKKDEVKEEKTETSIMSELYQNSKESVKDINQPKDFSVRESKELGREIGVTIQPSNKESKKTKKKNDILAQIGGDKDGVNVSLLIPLVQKAELSRSEIQILIDQLLNKQLDNPSEHSEWTEGRTDPVIKLKKQLAEKEKALYEEHEASIAFQNKLKELRVEFNSEKTRLSSNIRQLEEALNVKMTEAKTSNTRMQHILESHAAEKQGFARQIEQLQTKINEDAAIIHNMQEEGQTKGHMQQELIAQRKQLEAQYAQMRDNENALKTQLAQKHVEVQELQNVNVSVSQELQATCETTSTEIEVLSQQLTIMQERLMHSEGQLQHLKEESRRTQTDLDHRLKSVHRREQELQKQVNSLQSELNLAKSEAGEAVSMKAECMRVQSELMKLKSELSVSQNETKTEAIEITTLRKTLSEKEDEIQSSLSKLSDSQNELLKLKTELTNVQTELNQVKTEFSRSENNFKIGQNDLKNCQKEYKELQEELCRVQCELSKTEKLENTKVEIDRLQLNEKKSSEQHLQMIRLQEENDRLSVQACKAAELQKQLQEANESMAAQLAATIERPAAEGRENGIEEKVLKPNMQQVEQSNLLEQKEIQLDSLRVEFSQKKIELDRLKTQTETLRSEANKQHSLVRQLQEELEVQRKKNNELRTKNWKVMEALSAAEFQAKSKHGKGNDDDIEKMLNQERESTKKLLQRLFPNIKVMEKSHDRWISTFEEKATVTISESRNQTTYESNQQLEEQNKSLQGLVAHYKQIIDETEGILVKLQDHIESAETRWQVQLRQKESELATLRLEINHLQNKSMEGDKGGERGK